MFLFIRLALAHLIGDTILQPDEVYKVKEKGFYGVAIHAGIIFLTLVVFSFPYLRYLPLWFVLIFAGVGHLIQDEMKMRHFTAKKYNFIVFIVDQVIHITFLSPILIFKFADTPPAGETLIIQVYNNSALMIIVMGFVVSVFLGAYVWEAFKISYFRNPSLFVPSLIKYGMFERFVITVSAMKLPFLLFLIIPLFCRILSKQLRFSSDSVFNLVYSFSIGFFLRQFLPLF